MINNNVHIIHVIHVHILHIMLVVKINYFNKNNVFVVQQSNLLATCSYSINFWLYYSKL